MTLLESQILQLATQFINIPSNSLDEHIYKTLGTAGKYLGMDRAYLCEYDHKKHTMHNTHKWCAEGVDTCISFLQKITMEAYTQWTQKHLQGQSINIPSVKTLKDCNLKRMLELQGIQSLISIPLMDKERCLGFIGFDKITREIHWNDDHLSIAKMIAEIYTNVIKRRNIERRLMDSERRYEELVEGLPVGLYRRLPGFNGEFIMVNTAMAKMLGYDSKEDLIGVRISKFYVDKDEMRQFTAEMALTGEVREREVRFSRKNGQIFWGSISAKLHMDDAGNPLYVEGMVQDISERKRQEEEKERLQNQLQQAQRLESIGRLAGGIAHDFNNLLVPILGYSELLLELMNPNDATIRYIEPIKEAGEKAREIVKQLLAFGRKQELEKRCLNLEEYFPKFHKFLHHSLRDDIELIVRVSPDTPFVECDIRQLDQVLLNLAVNAQDAMPTGGRLTIEASKFDVNGFEAKEDASLIPGRYAKITVTDTGVGMDKKTLEHIFDPFFTTKSLDKGTGLGLAMAYGIIKQHGGNIKVKSEPGKGTRFEIFLPAVHKIHSQDVKGFDKNNVDADKRKTILLVEDEDYVRDFVAHALERSGYRVVKANGYQEALKRLKEINFEPTLLLTDVIMPEVGGVELYKMLKKDFPSLKVLYMSGNVPDTVSFEEGDKFLQKPFSIDTLQETIRNVIDDEAKRKTQNSSEKTATTSHSNYLAN